MTPASILWALRADELRRAATPSAAYALRLRRSSGDALGSRESRRQPETDLTMKDDVSVSVGRARFQALCQALRPDLFKLPEEYREPLVLQVLMGYSTAEIAAELGLTTGTVLTRLFRGRRQLRALCGGDTAMDPDA